MKEILEDVIVEIKTNFYFQIYNGIPHTSQALLILLFSYTYRLGADINIKNDRGETPYDLATKGGYENIIKKLCSHLGQSQLDRLMKHKTKA